MKHHFQVILDVFVESNDAIKETGHAIAELFAGNDDLLGNISLGNGSIGIQTIDVNSVKYNGIPSEPSK